MTSSGTPIRPIPTFSRTISPPKGAMAHSAKSMLRSIDVSWAQLCLFPLYSPEGSILCSGSRWSLSGHSICRHTIWT
ncbi:Peptide N-acetyl-beta-D-glucosaminyl asparaginase amidase A [Musa troglodytarum]|uniref:Peptide N-acetyl-beta-D-glucosaminyl asparaginase amidase A n=1 Tax=Musa troglodytarum TaxID=320322 RepID=A0A9E7H1P6_9LILI|nr:Peptide N-acetyl-beta-D-glucosaminyl asparaginase amidase A [Musa troglodytarum]